MSTSSPGLALYATSALTRHLSTQDRIALASAVQLASDDVYDDKIGIRVRRDGLQREMDKIARKAAKYLDDAGVLDRWETRIRRFFWEAGETEFAHEHLDVYLDCTPNPSRSLREDNDLHRIFTVSVSVSGTGIDLRLQQIHQEIDLLLNQIESSLESQPLDERSRDHYEHLSNMYAHQARRVLARPAYVDGTEALLSHWETIYETVKILQHLADEVPTSSLIIIIISRARSPAPSRADYAEERASELEVLESIFPDELQIISEDQISIQVEPENQNESDPYILNLVVTYTPTYPDELPEMEIQVVEGELSDEEESFLLDGLKTSGEESLGMAMVYTLSLQLRELIAEMFVQRKERIAREDDERYRKEEEAIAKKRQGTQVTKESFAAWSVKFEKEMLELRKKDEQERLKGLPGKEREEAKRWLAKQTGRQLFESDSTLVGSDAAFGDEGDVAVDFSQYERNDPANDDDDDDDETNRVGERLRLADLSDDE
ncbi:hypothetical protein JCM11491_001361 [Sporobolomyces phaffii]